MTEQATNPVVDDDVRVVDGEGVDQATDLIDATNDADDSETLEGEEQPDADDDSEEIEWEDGQKYRIPKPLKDAFLRHADYTRKTQEAASQRREAERQHAETVAQWQEADELVVDARAALKGIDNRLKEIDSLTDAQWAQIDTQDPARARALSREQMKLRDQRDQITGAVADRTARMEADRDQVLLERRQSFQAALPTEIPDWGPELDSAVTKTAIQTLGFKSDELKSLDDIRAAKTLYWAHRGLEAHRVQQKTQSIVQRQKTAPASTLRGQGGRFAVSPDTSDFRAFEALADEKLASR